MNNLARMVPALALVATVTLTGCSSSGSSPKASGGSSTGTTSSPATGGTSSAAPTTSAASSPAAVHLGSSFCQDAKIEKAQESSEIDAFTKDTPAELAKYENQGLAEIQAFINVAPSAIKPDVETIYTFTKQLYAALQKAGNDFSKLPPSTTASLESPSFTKAANAITAYLQSACGISPSDAAS